MRLRHPLGGNGFGPSQLNRTIAAKVTTTRTRSIRRRFSSVNRRIMPLSPLGVFHSLVDDVVNPAAYPEPPAGPAAAPPE